MSVGGPQKRKRESLVKWASEHWWRDWAERLTLTPQQQKHRSEIASFRLVLAEKEPTDHICSTCGIKHG